MFHISSSNLLSRRSRRGLRSQLLELFNAAGHIFTQCQCLDAVTLERQGVARGEEDLLNKRLDLLLHQTWQFGQDVTHLVHLTTLTKHPQPHASDGFVQTRSTIKNNQQRILQPPRDHILQKAQPRVIGLPRTEAQVQQYRTPILMKCAGTGITAGVDTNDDESNVGLTQANGQATLGNFVLAGTTEFERVTPPTGKCLTGYLELTWSTRQLG